MGGSSSKEDSPSDNYEKLQERMRKIIEEENKKKNDTREAQAASDARIKNLMRDVLKEEGNRKPSSSSESAKRNAMLMGILTEMLESRGTNNDKSKIINYLLDMQQNFGGSANQASGDIAKFIEKQLIELQSGVAQDVKITVEKKASGTASQPSRIDKAKAGPSSAGSYTHLMATTTVVPPRKPKPQAPPKPSQEEAKFLQKNIPNLQSTCIDYSEFEDLFKDSKAPQENLRNVVPTFKDNRPNQNSLSGGKPNQQDIHKVAPPASYFSDPLLNNNHFSSFEQNPEKGSSMTNNNQQFKEKQLPNKMPFKPNVPQHSLQSNIEKNQQKQVHGNESFKNGKDGYDNGPFLDRGPPLLKNKDEGSMVDQDWDGNFYVKLPPPLLDVFANTGKYPNNGQNQGRAGPHNRFRGNNQYRGPRRASEQRYGPDPGRATEQRYGPEPGRVTEQRYGPDPGRATEQRYGPDPGRATEQRYGPNPRNSQSPHRNQDRFQHDRNDGLLAFPPPSEGYYPGPNSEPYHGPNIANNRGAFQYRGDGARRPFPNRGKEFFPRERGQHFQNQGRGDFVPGLGPEQQNSRVYSIPGNPQPRMPRSERGNNLNHYPRSFSQPRVRHSVQTQDNAGGQETNSKQANKGPRGSYRGQGAFSRARYNKGRGGGAKYNKQKKQQGAWNAETDENKCDDSDNDSVKTDISTKSAPSMAMEEAAAAAGEEKKKKKTRSRSKNKLKNASSATNLTTSQNDSGEDTQSHSNTVEGVSTVEKDESSAPLENAAPLELLVGALDNQTLENLSPDQELGHAIVVIAKVDDGVRSYHPTTVGELLSLKKKYPNAEVIVVR